MQEGNPQVEDGFTRIANELFDAVLRAPLTGTEQKVVLAVIRLTYGYNKREDTLSFGQIATATGLERRCVIRAMGRLKKANVLTCKRTGPYSPSVWSVQKKYPSWNLTSATDATSAKPDTSVTYVTSSSDTSDTRTSDTSDTHQRQKDKKDREGTRASAKAPRHPALLAYQSETHRNVAIAWKQKVMDTVGEFEADVAFWKDLVHAYMGTYGNAGNVKAMLDFYDRRELPGEWQRKPAAAPPSSEPRLRIVPNDAKAEWESW